MPGDTIDPVLHAVARLAEHGFSLTATVTLNGTVISGRVISARRYLLGIRHQFNAQVHEENLPGLDEILALFDTVSESSITTFLHLEDAAIHDGSPEERRPKAFWRIRLHAVDGFSFGR